MPLETSAFPTAAEVMGPKFQWMATNPGDPQIPFGRIAPEGGSGYSCFGAKVVGENGDQRFEVPAGGHVIVAISVMDNRDSAEYFRSSIAGLHHASVSTIAAMRFDDPVVSVYSSSGNKV
jgi:hypothetical protein